MRELTMQITGARQVQAHLHELALIAPQTSTRILRKITLDLKGKATRRAPVKKGDLRRSSFAESSDSEGVVGFTQPYATIQHEHLEFNHPKGGEAKYLHKPLQENEDRYRDMIKDALVKALGA